MPITEAEKNPSTGADGPQLTSDRLLLRPHVPQDMEVLVEFLGNRNVSRWTASIPHPYKKEDAEIYLADAADQWTRGEAFHFGVTSRDINALIGSVGLRHRAPWEGAEKAWELGYWVAEPFWGQGYAGEAVALILVYGFGVRNLPLFFAKTDPENLGSQRVLERNGFQFIREREAPCGLRGDICTRYYELNQVDWRGRKTKPL